MEPQVGFVGSFLPTAARDKVRGGFSSFPELLDPRLLVSVWTGDLKMDTGVPQSVYRIDTEDMERIGLWALRIGETYQFEVGSITFNGVIPWVNLQVVRDPGKQYALFGSILAIIGLMASLFIRQRRIWVREVNGKLEIAGLALNRLPGLDEEIKKMATEMKEAKRLRQIGHMSLMIWFMERSSSTQSLSFSIPMKQPSPCAPIKKAHQVRSTAPRLQNQVVSPQ
jgi:cytochrome c biogenesis protein